MTDRVSQEVHAKIQQLADNLQIHLYIREDGTVHQHPPGERVEFTKHSVCLDHGHSELNEPQPEG